MIEIMRTNDPVLISFVEATLALALERPDMADEVRAIMKRLLAP
jgi:hypothetical protein